MRGVEGLDAVQLFADAGVFDGLARHGPDAEGRAAAGVAVQLGEEDAVDAQGVVEGFGCVHRVLAGHGVQHQHDLVGLHRRLDVFQLVHQGFVDVEAARGVQQNHVVAVLPGVLDGGGGDLHRVGRAHLEHRDAHLRADGDELLDGGGTVDVAGGQKGPFAVLFQQGGQLGAVGGFARALEAHQHDDRGGLGGHVDLGVLLAHGLRQLFIDDLDDHLGGGQALQHVLPQGTLADPGDKILDHLVADVRFQEGQAHVPHGLLDVGFAQPSFAAQLFEGIGKFFG